jgi:hypothetical protein
MKPPPVIGARRLPRLPLVMGAGVLALGLAFLFAFDPARYGFYPRCFFHATTGLHCPGCGGLRGMHELLHGHWLTALRLNFLAFGVAPVLILIGLSERLHRGEPQRPSVWERPWFLWLLAGLVLVFGVLRNVPLAPFTLLAPGAA